MKNLLNAAGFIRQNWACIDWKTRNWLFRDMGLQNVAHAMMSSDELIECLEAQPDVQDGVSPTLYHNVLNDFSNAIAECFVR